MRKAALVRRIRARAPKHPPGPEAQLRFLLARVIRAERGHQRRALLKHIREDAPRPRTVARNMLRKQAKRAADQMARDAHVKAAKALGVKVAETSVDLDERAWNLADGVVRIFEDYSLDVTHRAHSLLAEAMGEDAETEVAGVLDAAESGAFNSLRLLFSKAWGEMQQDTQEQLGAEGYMWVSSRDPHTREAHRELDDEKTVYSYDDPPLKAEDADNGEDCNPGDDYNCRCIASPVTAEEQDEIEGS